MLRDKIVQTKDGTAPAKFGYVNFETPTEAANAFQNAKTDPEVLKLLNSAIPNYRDFLFYHQQRDDRKRQLQQTQNKQSKIDMTNPEVAKLFMEYMKKMVGNKNGQLSTIMQNMMGNKMGGSGANKPPHQPQRMNPNPMMNPMAMNIPLMQTKPQGMGSVPGMNRPGPGMMNMNPMMNPMMMNPQMSNPSLLDTFNSQGMPQYFPNNMMMPSQMSPIQINPAFGMQQQSNASPDINWILSNKKEFESFPPDKIKKNLGSILYPLVHKQVNNQELTAKVTGMLIDLDVLTVIFVN